MLLVSGNLRFVLQGEADLIEPLQQALLAERVNVEMKAGARRGSHRLRRQINGEPVAGPGFHFFEQLGNFFGLQHDREHTVLEAVVKKDVGKARGDEAAESVIEQRPGRVLTRGAAAKVVTRQQDGRALVARLVEKERSIAGAVAAVAPVGK